MDNGTFETALDVIDEMIAKQNYTKQELHILFQRIVVYDDHVDFYFKGCFSDQVDTIVSLAEAEKDKMRYRKAIIREMRAQAVDGRISLLKVHKGLVEQGYKHSYKGVFKKEIQELEKQGTITRSSKNKRAVFHEGKVL